MLKRTALLGAVVAAALPFAPAQARSSTSVTPPWESVTDLSRCDGVWVDCSIGSNGWVEGPSMNGSVWFTPQVGTSGTDAQGVTGRSFTTHVKPPPHVTSVEVTYTVDVPRAYAFMWGHTGLDHATVATWATAAFDGCLPLEHAEECAATVTQVLADTNDVVDPRGSGPEVVVRDRTVTLTLTITPVPGKSLGDLALTWAAGGRVGATTHDVGLEGRDCSGGNSAVLPGGIDCSGYRVATVGAPPVRHGDVSLDASLRDVDVRWVTT
jgi:hypothetical protein